MTISRPVGRGLRRDQAHLIAVTDEHVAIDIARQFGQQHIVMASGGRYWLHSVEVDLPIKELGLVVSDFAQESAEDLNRSDIANTVPWKVVNSRDVPADHLRWLYCVDDPKEKILDVGTSMNQVPLLGRTPYTMLRALVPIVHDPQMFLLDGIIVGGRE